MTLINSSFNSLDLDLSSEDRELSHTNGDNATHQRVQPSDSWAHTHFENSQSTSSASNYVKRVTYQQDRRGESMFPQNPRNYSDERNSQRELEEELRSSELHQEPGTVRLSVPPAAVPKRNSSSFGCEHSKEPQRNTNAMSPQAFPRRNSSFRQDNFDHRNVETFGVDVVEGHQYGVVPTRSGLCSVSARKHTLNLTDHEDLTLASKS